MRRNASTAPARLRVCLVEFSVVSRELEFSYAAAPGRIVNLDERLAKDITLSDVTRPGWFGPLANDKKETDDDGA